MEETRRRRFARAAAVPIGLLASGALVFAGSQSAFTATTTNAGNSWAAGTMTLENDAAVGTFAVASTPIMFSPANVKPGDTSTKCVVVKSTSSIAGSIRFYFTAVSGASSGKPGALPLTSQLLLTVDAVDGAKANDCSNFGSTGVTSVYGGSAGKILPNTTLPLGTDTNYSWTSAAAGAVSAAIGPVSKTYRIKWELPSTATDVVQGGSAGAILNWEIQNT